MFDKRYPHAIKSATPGERSAQLTNQNLCHASHCPSEKVLRTLESSSLLRTALDVSSRISHAAR